MKCLQAWQQALVVAWLTPPSPGSKKDTGALSVRRNTPQTTLSMHNKFHLNDLCAAQSYRSNKVVY